MVEVVEEVAKRMIDFMRPRIRKWGYREARNAALATYSFSDTTEEESRAYKLYLDEYFRSKAKAAIRLKHRPRPPLSVYEGDTR